MAEFDLKLIPHIKEGKKTKWTILKKIENWILVDCADGVFTWVLLSKEVKELERSGYDLDPGREIEVEIVNTNIRHEDGHYIISITKLLQYDIWKSIIKKFEDDQIISVVPTEANLGWLLVDMHGIKWFVPLSQLAPIHYPRVEDWDQDIIFDKLLDLIGKELRVRIINIDEEEKRIILSEREALKEERDAVMSQLEVGKIFDWVVSGISSYWLFVTIWGTVEWLVHISEITYWHVNNIDRLWTIWEKIQVKVIWLENGKISLSSKKLKDDPWTALPKAHKVGDIIETEVVRFVPYGVFVRVFQDINWLVHLSELSQRSIQNPNEVVKLWQIVKTKIILLDPKNRKIWLSMKWLLEWDNIEKSQAPRSENRPTAPVSQETTVAKSPAKSKWLGDIVKKLSEDKDTVGKTEAMMENAPKEVKKIAKTTKKPETEESDWTDSKPKRWRPKKEDKTE